MTEPYKITYIQYSNDYNIDTVIRAIHEVLRALEVISKQLEEMDFKLGRKK